jgi:hypothetical protein
MKIKSALTISVLAVALAGFIPASAQGADLITELDSVVVSMHDYSLLNGQIAKKATTEQVQATVSRMNSQLFTIKSALSIYDSSVTKNWKFLSPKTNATYPARMTLRQFDLAAYAWYNYEVGAQKQIAKCYKNVATSKACVINWHTKHKSAELAKYSKVTDQLTIIQKWRTAVGR